MPRLFDLEDEDNMLHVEDADEDMQDNFVNFSLISQQTTMQVEADSDDEAEERSVPCSIVAAKAELGLIEAEITDFTIKKIVETLVNDFPVSSTRVRDERVQPNE